MFIIRRQSTQALEQVSREAVESPSLETDNIQQLTGRGPGRPALEDAALCRGIGLYNLQSSLPTAKAVWFYIFCRVWLRLLGMLFVLRIGFFQESSHSCQLPPSPLPHAQKSHVPGAPPQQQKTSISVMGLAGDITHRRCSLLILFTSELHLSLRSMLPGYFQLLESNIGHRWPTFPIICTQRSDRNRPAVLLPGKACSWYHREMVKTDRK